MDLNFEWKINSQIFICFDLVLFVWEGDGVIQLWSSSKRHTLQKEEIHQVCCCIIIKNDDEDQHFFGKSKINFLSFFLSFFCKLAYKKTIIYLFRSSLEEDQVKSRNTGALVHHVCICVGKVKVKWMSWNLGFLLLLFGMNECLSNFLAGASLFHHQPSLSSSSN